MSLLKIDMLLFDTSCSRSSHSVKHKAETTISYILLVHGLWCSHISLSISLSMPLNIFLTITLDYPLPAIATHSIPLIQHIIHLYSVLFLLTPLSLLLYPYEHIRCYTDMLFPCNVSVFWSDSQSCWSLLPWPPLLHFSWLSLKLSITLCI